MTFDSSRRPCDSEALATSSYEMNFAQPLSDDTLVRAAVRVVLPWSMWPMVPTLTCGLLRSNFSLAISAILALRSCDGADVQNRTGDLVLTKDALCQRRYIAFRLWGLGQQVGLPAVLSCRRSAPPPRGRAGGAVARREIIPTGGRRLERETGIEPATNSLEGC